jgi:hypothetical protein
MKDIASKNLNSVLTANNTFKFIAEKTEFPSVIDSTVSEEGRMSNS